MKILNFGSLNLDKVYSVPHITGPGETNRAARMNLFPGGKGLNQSIALARAGVQVFHAGCIGADGEELRTLLTENGVDTRYLKTVPGRTGHAVIQVDDAGQNAIFVLPGSNASVTPEQIRSVLSDFSPGDLLLLQNEISCLPELVELAFARGLRVYLNPSPFNEVIGKLDLSHISCLILNEVEAAAFVGTRDIGRFFAFMKEYYPHLAIMLTLGEQGCIYRQEGKGYRHPAFAVRAVDTTAAGDTFTGYFVAAVSRGQSPQEALALASAAAALAVTQPGAAASIPTRDKVFAALQTLPSRSVDKPDRAVFLRQYIRENPATASINDLSEKLHYSPRYTGKWVRVVTGESFTTLLGRTRCELAAYELANTDRPVHEIIAAMGYQNEGHFRKMFFAVYHKTPLAYRKAEQSKKNK